MSKYILKSKALQYVKDNYYNEIVQYVMETYQP